MKSVGERGSPGTVGIALGFLWLVYTVALTGAGAVDTTALMSGAKADLEQALRELAQTREQIESERTALVRQVREWEERVLTRRGELERARRAADNELVELNAWRAELRTRSNELAAIEALLHNYHEALAGRLQAVEMDRYEPALRAFQAARSSDAAPPAERLAQQLRLLEIGLQRLEQRIGGEQLPGRALNSQGQLVEGQFLLMGPLAWFSTEGSPPVAGVVQMRLNSPAPELALPPHVTAQAISEVIRTARGILPVDPTLGNAWKLQTTRDSFWTHIQKGGPVMVPILLLGGLALGIFAWKWIQLHRLPEVTPAVVAPVLEALERGNPEQALHLARQLPGPGGRMLAAAVEHWREPKEFIEEILYEKMLALRPTLERGIPFLALTAAAAPLLGLLGTVTGMINTFNVITVFGTGDPKTLAGGISEALITTEFGLIVAIPALLLHAILSRKVKGWLGRLEQVGVGFLNALPEGDPAGIRR
jgi:biopolymer transport protein ExbB